MSGGPVDALPHHQTIELAIDWSYDMLDPEQQVLFCRLSVFRGGFTLDAFGAVMGTEDEFEALDAIGEVVDKSLVRVMPAEEETRYNLLEPLRPYSATRISADEAAATGGRHARYFQDLAEQVAPQLYSPQQIELLARLEREHDDLRAALAWSLDAGNAELGQRTAAALFWLWIVRRHVVEGTDWLDRVLAADGGPSPARAYELLQCGFISTMVRQKDLEGCQAQIREARAQFVELGDARGVLTAENYDGIMLWWLRDLDASRRGLTEIQAAHRANGFEWGDAFCGWFLGSAAWLMGDMTQPYAHYTRSLDLYRPVGDLTFIAWTLLPLANISLKSSDLDQAKGLYGESRDIMGDMGYLHGLGAVFFGLGMLAQLRGDTDGPQLLLTEAQTNLRERSGGQELSWPLSNALAGTSSHDLLVEAPDRYQASLSLPPDEWARMVCSDGEAWRARTNI